MTGHFTMTAKALMVDKDNTAGTDLLLQEYDFPETFVNMAHPEDGIVKAMPMTPEFIRYSRGGNHFELLQVLFE